jgi:hypothetical protein
VAAGQALQVVVRSSLQIKSAHVQLETVAAGSAPVFGAAVDVDAGATFTVPPLPVGHHILLVSAQFETPFSRGDTGYAFGLDAR